MLHVVSSRGLPTVKAAMAVSGTVKRTCNGASAVIQKRTSSVLYFLRKTYRTAANDASERRNNAGLLQLKVGCLEVSFGGLSIVAVASNFGDRLINPVFRVLPAFFADDLFGAHRVCTPQIGLCHSLFCFPLPNLGLRRGDARFLRFASGAKHSIIEESQYLTLLYAIPDSSCDVHYAAFSFGRDVGLLFGDEWSGGREGFWIYRVWRLDEGARGGGVFSNWRIIDNCRACCLRRGLGITSGNKKQDHGRSEKRRDRGDGFGSTS